MQEKNTSPETNNEHVKNLGGRPPAELNVDYVERLAEKHWTKREIAAFFRVSEDTIHRRFAAEIDAARERGKAKLRDMQWKLASEGNTQITIWLAKQYLGQTDKIDQRVISTTINVDTDKAKELNTKIQSQIEEKSAWEKQLLISPPKSS